MRLAELPEMQARREQGTVDARRELLRACVQRVAPRGIRRSLNDPRAGIGFHQPHERGEALPAHDAVGVEDDQIAIVPAPPAAEIGDVSALALDAMLSPAVEDAPEGVERPAGLEPCLDFCDARVRIIGVRQHEPVSYTHLTLPT